MSARDAIRDILTAYFYDPVDPWERPSREEALAMAQDFMDAYTHELAEKIRDFDCGCEFPCALCASHMIEES